MQVLHTNSILISSSALTNSKNRLFCGNNIELDKQSKPCREKFLNMGMLSKGGALFIVIAGMFTTIPMILRDFGRQVQDSQNQFEQSTERLKWSIEEEQDKFNAFNDRLNLEQELFKSATNRLLGETKDLKDKVDKIIPMEVISQVAAMAAPATVMIEGRFTGGSGVIVESEMGEWFILTNGHVTRSYEKNELGMYDEAYYRVFPWEGTDFNNEPYKFEASLHKLQNGQKTESPQQENDLALLKVPEDAVKRLSEKGVKPLLLRDTQRDPLVPGEPVIAIGNPYTGLKKSVERDNVTAGVISHIARSSPLEPENIFIEFSAAINPGNSGGALVDKDGRFIGTVTIGVRGADGLGCAIRDDIIEKVVQNWGITLRKAN